jgi:hypothetical protein
MSLSSTTRRRHTPSSSLSSSASDVRLIVNSRCQLPTPNKVRHLFRSGFELVYDQSVRSRLTGSLGRQMKFLELDSSFVS